MSIIKRKIGALSGTSKISLVINGNTIKKLINNEEYTLDIKEPSAYSSQTIWFWQ